MRSASRPVPRFTTTSAPRAPDPRWCCTRRLTGDPEAVHERSPPAISVDGPPPPAADDACEEGRWREGEERAPCGAAPCTARHATRSTPPRKCRRPKSRAPIGASPPATRTHAGRTIVAGARRPRRRRASTPRARSPCEPESKIALAQAPGDRRFASERDSVARRRPSSSAERSDHTKTRHRRRGWGMGSAAVAADDGRRRRSHRRRRSSRSFGDRRVARRGSRTRASHACTGREATEIEPALVARRACRRRARCRRSCSARPRRTIASRRCCSITSSAA